MCHATLKGNRPGMLLFLMHSHEIVGPVPASCAGCKNRRNND